RIIDRAKSQAAHKWVRAHRSGAPRVASRTGMVAPSAAAFEMKSGNFAGFVRTDPIMRGALGVATDFGCYLVPTLASTQKTESTGPAESRRGILELFNHKREHSRI